MENNKLVKLNGGYYSARLDTSQSRWSPCEKETLGIKLNIEHFRPFIRESLHTTIIHPDNMISVLAWNRLKKGIISSSSKVAAFLASLSENNIDLQHCPGIQTKVADYGSRNPPICTESRCQICKYMQEQCRIGEHCTVNSISVEDILSGTVKPPLMQKPAWLSIQKQDETHRKLHSLITSGGLQPGKKMKNNTDLKLLYNLYSKGLLKIDSFGVIVIKHIDTVSGQQYEAISVPRKMYPSIIQSLHIKMDHPSRNQMHKFAHRYFHCIGSTQAIDNIHKSCQICTSLSLIPTATTTHSTEKNPIFGANFSADVLVSGKQKIFLCREKLSQFTTTKIIQDETAESLKEAILLSVLDLIPSSGTVIQVDAAPGFRSIHKSLSSLENDDMFAKYGIKLDIGRVYNSNKNPIAENSIKEFRKERLRLNPRGGPVTETERLIITKNMNSRIRNRGFSAKEILLRRDLTSNKTVPVDDPSLADVQYNLRNQVNSKHNENITKSDTDFSIGDRIFLKKDISKLRSREEFIIVELFTKKNVQWAKIQKLETQFRKKIYDVQISEITHVSTNFKKYTGLEDNFSQPFHGFSSQDVSQRGLGLDQLISSLENDSSNVNVIESEHKNVLLHGYLQQELDSDDDEDDDLYPILQTNPPQHTSSPLADHNHYQRLISLSSETEPDTDQENYYISSDDDPFDHTLEYSNWEEPLSSYNQQNLRFRSETDPHILQRVQIVSTDSSSLESEPDTFDQTLQQEEEFRVFDFTAALEAINSVPPNQVVNLDRIPSPTPLPSQTRSSRQTTSVNYKLFNQTGKKN